MFKYFLFLHTSDIQLEVGDRPHCIIDMERNRRSGNTEKKTLVL